MIFDTDLSYVSLFLNIPIAFIVLWLHLIFFKLKISYFTSTFRRYFFGYKILSWNSFPHHLFSMFGGWNEKENIHISPSVQLYSFSKIELVSNKPNSRRPALLLPGLFPFILSVFELWARKILDLGFIFPVSLSRNSDANHSENGHECINCFFFSIQAFSIQ